MILKALAVLCAPIIFNRNGERNKWLSKQCIVVNPVHSRSDVRATPRLQRPTWIIIQIKSLRQKYIIKQYYNYIIESLKASNSSDSGLSTVWLAYGPQFIYCPKIEHIRELLQPTGPNGHLRECPKTGHFPMAYNYIQIICRTILHRLPYRSLM